MKFGNLLRSSAEDVPELQNLFLCYKQLKKKLKRLPARPLHSSGNGVDRAATLEERSFVQTLNSDVLHFNDLFIEKEEESVIKLGDLEEQAAEAMSPTEIAQVLTRAVDLHGQLLLLVHWSILAYTGLVKILKKHHKRTGLPIRAPHLEDLLSQPFCSVELLTQLVRKAEDTSQQLATRLRSSGGKPEEAAKGSNSPSSPIGDLILAARNSFHAIAGDAAGHVDQASTSDDSSADHRQSAAGDSHCEDAAASAPPPAKLTGSAEVVEASAADAGTQQAPPSITQGKRHMPEASGQPPTKRQQVDGPPAAQPDSTSAQCVVSAAAGHQREGGAGLAAVRQDDGGQISKQPPRTHVAASAVAMPPPAIQGQRASVMRQTQAALGLWAQLHDTASTPSTVLQPFTTRRSESMAPSQSTDQSAA